MTLARCLCSSSHQEVIPLFPPFSLCLPCDLCQYYGAEVTWCQFQAWASRGITHLHHSLLSPLARGYCAKNKHWLACWIRKDPQNRNQLSHVRSFSPNSRSSNYLVNADKVSARPKGLPGWACSRLPTCRIMSQVKICVGGVHCMHYLINTSLYLVQGWKVLFEPENLVAFSLPYRQWFFEFTRVLTLPSNISIPFGKL